MSRLGITADMIYRPILAVIVLVASAAFGVVPQPETMTAGEGVFQIKSAQITGPDGRGLRAAVELLKLQTTQSGDSAAISLKLDPSASALGAEGYELNVTDKKVQITAMKDAGLFYGVQTLAQLVDGSTIPAVHIIDKPRFPYRGYMLDSCRHMQSKQYIKQLIDQLSALKINRFHWHLTEDQGWRIEIKKYPKLTEIGSYREKDGQRYGGFYTQADIREVVQYAEDHCMVVIPEIEMPGHSSAALSAYPWLGCTGGPYKVRWEWGISEDVYCAGKETTYEFCENVLDEVMQLFPNSPVIHIGGDECPKSRWHACPNCQAMIKEKHLKDENALQGYFTSRIAHYLADHGRRLQGWNEIMEGTDLPPGVIVQQWSAPNSARDAARAGLDVVCSPTTNCYFDYGLDTTPTEKVYAFEPIPADLQPELNAHILGPQANVWTEGIVTEKDVQRMTFPRIAALAEVGWSEKKSRNWSDFQTRMTHYIATQPEDQREGWAERMKTPAAKK